MRRPGSRLLLIAAPTLVLLVAATVADRAVEASIRHLRRAVVVRPDGSQLVLLSALRQLKDPTLRSFFYQLAQDDDPGLRIHAILGLGEIDESGQIDPWLIRQLASPEARYTVIATALGSDLIDTARINVLLDSEDLEPKSRVLLSAALVARGEPLEAAALARLSDNPSLITAGMVACLLVQAGDETAFSGYRARVAELPARSRNRHLVAMFERIGSHNLTETLDWVVEMLSDPNADPEVVAWGLAVVLRLDAPRGVPLWSHALGDDPQYGRCIRYARLLLGAGAAVDPAAYDRLPAGDELIDRMVRAGKAVSSGEDTCPALIDLLRLAHPNTARWVMKAARELADEQAACVYGHVIDSVEGDPDGRSVRVELAINATARLFAIDADAVIDRLARAEDNSLTQETMLMGLLESRSPLAGEAARQVKRIGFGRADSLALILIAKHATRLTPQELSELGVVAAGGGRISEVLQTQAAWLYLKHSSSIEKALAETFAEATPH